MALQSPLSYHWRILAIAWPIVLSNATTPLQGAVDTAIIGQMGVVSALAAIGLGAELFALLFISFNFLQIGVSGLSAQAKGGQATAELNAVLLRGLMLGGLIGLALILLQTPLAYGGLALFEASAQTEDLAQIYFNHRIWGAPAELMNYALMGWFAGQALTGRLVRIQLIITVFNIKLTVFLVRYMEMGVAGAATATAAASYIGLLYGLWLAFHANKARAPRLHEVLNSAKLRSLMALNRDIFIRTFLLVGGIAWMARLGAQQGDLILAANVVLWQFFTISAYALDGFAIAAETLVGQAFGAKKPREFDQAAFATSLWAAVLAVLISCVFMLFHGPVIDIFSTAPDVRATARDYALWAALIPLVGFAAFQMDGIFVGATGSREMRNGMIASCVLYYPTAWILTHIYGNHGLWCAVWIWLLARACALAVQYPLLRARITLQNSA